MNSPEQVPPAIDIPAPDAGADAVSRGGRNGFRCFRVCILADTPRRLRVRRLDGAPRSADLDPARVEWTEISLGPIRTLSVPVAHAIEAGLMDEGAA